MLIIYKVMSPVYILLFLESYAACRVCVTFSNSSNLLSCLGESV